MGWKQPSIATMQYKAYFPDICLSSAAEECKVDDTFLATLQVLLGPRGGKIELGIIATASLRRGVGNNQLVICRDESAGSIPPYKLDELLPTRQFREEKDIQLYLSQAFGLRSQVLISNTRRITVIFLPALTQSRWHRIQALIPRLLPWIFSSKPINDDERQMLSALSADNEEAYLHSIEKLVNQQDLGSLILTRALSGFETQLQQLELQRVKGSIRSFENVLAELEAQYQTASMQLSEQRTKLFGLEVQLRENQSCDSVLDFFQHHQGTLFLEEAVRGKISFSVRTKLNNFDPDVFRALISNPRSYLFQISGLYTDTEICQLLEAIFQTERLKVTLCAAYSLDFANPAGDGVAHKVFTFPGCEDCIPNPHIQKYACLGDYKIPLMQAVRNADYITAIDLCIASAGSVNLEEAASAEYLFAGIFSHSAKRIITLPDGSNVTPAQALEYLKQEETHES